MGYSTRWVPVAVTSAVAALLACAAVVTVHHAACDEPGSYVIAPGGVELVGACLRSDDLPIAPPPEEQPPEEQPPEEQQSPDQLVQSLARS